MTALAVLLYFHAVRGPIGMTWDEPPDIGRSYSTSTWFSILREEGIGRAFEEDNLLRGWPYCREAPDEHPPLVALVTLVSWQLLDGYTSSLTAHRAGAMLLFALGLVVVAEFVRTRWGWQAALVAAGTYLFNPRFFAHGNFVAMDAPVAVASIVAAIVFLRGCEKNRHLWLFGIFLGLACMTKATGILVLPAMLLWSLVYRSWPGLRSLAWTIILTPVIVVLLHPGWWRNPIGGVLRWIDAMLAYPQMIPFYYFGTVYNRAETLPPWHNPFGVLGIMVPLGVLIPAVAGIGCWVVTSNCCNWRFMKTEPSSEEGSSPVDGPGNLLPAHVVAGWAVCQLVLPIVLRMFSILPIHDGVRQLTMLFPPLAILAGYAVFCFSRLGKWGALLRWAIFLGVCSSAYELSRIHPFELSYFNPLIGGARGAEKAGLDVTYYWDSVTPETLDWMNDQLPYGAKVLIFPPTDVRVFDWYQRWKLLRADLKFINLNDDVIVDELRRFAAFSDHYMILQRRESMYVPAGRNISMMMTEVSHAPAVFEVRPPQLGLRLLAIFDQPTFAKIATKYGNKSQPD